MVCPYAVDRESVQQVTYEYTDDGGLVITQSIEKNTAKFAKCQQEDCGAWLSFCNATKNTKPKT